MLAGARGVPPEDIKNELFGVEVIKGASLYGGHLDGHCDPYVVVSLGGTKVKTRTISNSCDPEFNEKLSVRLAPDLVRHSAHICPSLQTYSLQAYLNYKPVRMLRLHTRTVSD